MRFQYPLQKIVDLKGSEKAMAEWEYAAALGELRREEEKLSELLRERGDVEQALEQATQRPTPLARLTALQQYINVLDDRIRSQSQGVRRAAAQAERRQSRLSDKMVDEKVWLNARERAHDKFKVERLAREQNELDEIAIVRAAAAARA